MSRSDRRIDGAIQEEEATVLAAMGLTVSGALRLLLTKVAHEKALPFAPLVPNAATIEAMREARRGNLPQFASVEDLSDDLRADDSADQPVQARLQARVAGSAPGIPRRQPGRSRGYPGQRPAAGAPAPRPRAERRVGRFPRLPPEAGSVADLPEVRRRYSASGASGLPFGTRSLTLARARHRPGHGLAAQRL